MIHSIDNPDSDEKTLMSNNNGMFDHLRGNIRSVILLGLTLVFSKCGPSNFSKDMEDIPAEEEEGVTFLNQQDIKSATLELRKILPPDELIAFEKYRNAVAVKEKIDNGFYFIFTYPNSIAVPKVRAEIAWYEIDLQNTIDKLFSAARENPPGFLTGYVVGAGRDEFLTSAFTFATRFPHNPNRERVIQLVERYVEIMGYAYVKIDPSDSRLTNQTVVKSGEFAFAKFYRHYEHVNPGQMWNIWTPVTKFDFYEWVVISTDGERVGISEITQRSEGAGMLVETAVSGLQTYLVITDILNRALQHSIESGLLSPEVLDAYDRIGNSATPINNDAGANTLSGQSSQQTDLQRSAVKNQKKDECDLSCKRNWVDSCSTGSHTLLPGENYTKAECDIRFHECLDLCDRKYPSKTKP